MNSLYIKILFTFLVALFTIVLISEAYAFDQYLDMTLTVSPGKFNENGNYWYSNTNQPTIKVTMSQSIDSCVIYYEELNLNHNTAVVDNGNGTYSCISNLESDGITLPEDGNRFTIYAYDGEQRYVNTMFIMIDTVRPTSKISPAIASPSDEFIFLDSVIQVNDSHNVTDVKIYHSKDSSEWKELSMNCAGYYSCTKYLYDTAPGTHKFYSLVTDAHGLQEVKSQTSEFTYTMVASESESNDIANNTEPTTSLSNTPDSSNTSSGQVVPDNNKETILDEEVSTESKKDRVEDEPKIVEKDNTTANLPNDEIEKDHTSKYIAIVSSITVLIIAVVSIIKEKQSCK